MIQSILLVALGGAAGSVARFLVVGGVGRVVPGWPLGTLAVNVAGSLAIGVLYVLLTQRVQIAPLLVAGFLGGFTTFSAFSLDTLKLWEGGQAMQAALYVAASVILSLAAVALGAALARSIPA
ncbi:fluoride efflux transporter CrcB [Rhodobacteraceae bacterium HSP-20]|uniref:Fluoride-specific ion channel FluC n=1 Tax=Paragemmobacter amnigenus TaxID=2852097 RepID=A0ABS6J3W9_9RHOB|nr:fluoride efflux transporter CrcB [Rhodobacter amnigenus]MBU9697137.1 fluoride efflux transporter CrcB [Rhodobacter amnigenus]MBV4388364.1 fluoride efflux transporter CrcB [Rhodobacter amnigenus]